MSDGGDEAARRRNVIAEYRKKLLSYKEIESRVRTGFKRLLLFPFFFGAIIFTV